MTECPHRPAISGSSTTYSTISLCYTHTRTQSLTTPCEITTNTDLTKPLVCSQSACDAWAHWIWHLIYLSCVQAEVDAVWFTRLFYCRRNSLLCVIRCSMRIPEGGIVISCQSLIQKEKCFSISRSQRKREMVGLVKNLILQFSPLSLLSVCHP